MKTVEIAFSDDEKEQIKSVIVALSLSDDRVYNRNGYEFDLIEDNFPFLGDMWLNCTVSLWADMGWAFPPEEPIFKQRSVLKLDIHLMDDGEEVKTNLDYEFEESVKKELTI